jgi:hypothetical protein
MGFLSMQAGRDPTLMTRASRGRGSPQAAAADARGGRVRPDAGRGPAGT